MQGGYTVQNHIYVPLNFNLSYIHCYAYYSSQLYILKFSNIIIEIRIEIHGHMSKLLCHVTINKHTIKY